jgi:isopentenyl diphosphate isomerase/L-lactate dehydrogenase-like FMN-dependent dehydrogenase
MEPAEPLNLADYERLAEERLPADVFGYYAGGAEDERTLRENIVAWARWRLRPRVLVDVAEVRTATTVLGQDLSLPVLLAPVAFQQLAHPEGERATARAAAAAGTVMCLSTLANVGPAELAETAPPAPRWFQLYCYRDAGVTRALVDEAAAGGYSAIVLTADAPVGAKRERDIRSGFRLTPEVAVPSLTAVLGGPAQGTTDDLFSLISPSLTWRDLDRLCSESGLPVVVKGILTGEDARLACEHGAAAVLVSNHGGRQLDGVATAADVLDEVVEAVEGRVEVLADGGIRRGSDVVKALALGARAVAIGRGFLWALAVDGENGVRHVLDLLRDELQLALALCGCPTPDDVTRAHVARER